LENLEFLREYASRLLVEDYDSLVPIGDFKDVLLTEYLVLEDTLGLTERDLMILVSRAYRTTAFNTDQRAITRHGNWQVQSDLTSNLRASCTEVDTH